MFLKESVHEKTRQEVIQLKSPILLKLGTNVGFGEKMNVLEKEVEKFYFFQVRGTPRKNDHLTLIYIYLISHLW